MTKRYYPSQQELMAPDKLERVMRDIYDRIYATPKPTAPVAGPTIINQTTTVTGNNYVPPATSTATTVEADTVEAGQFSLTTGVWDDTQQSAIALRDTGANVPSLTQVGATSIWLPQFDVNDLAVFCHQFPHTLKEDSTVTVYPHVHWISDSTDTNKVVWELTYQWLNNNTDVIVADSTRLTVEVDPVDHLLQIASFPTVSKVDARVSSIFMGRIRRISNGGTDYSGNVFLAFFDLHYQCDTLGSDLEGQKTYPS